LWWPGFTASVDLMKIKQPFLYAALMAALAPAAAFAAPGNSTQMSGTVMASVVTPGAVVPLRALRFGQFLQPAAAGTITIAANSTMTPSAGMAANTSIPQLAPGRGAGAFTLTGGANRLFLLTLPTTATLSNGAASMNVTNFTANTLFAGIGSLNASGNFVLNVGARLNIGGGQTIGSYTGTYNVTVFFL
jgi:hypothetical protein